MSIARPHPLRVGVDLSPVVVGQTGVRRYSHLLWEHLSKRSELSMRAVAFGRGPDFKDGNVLRLEIPMRVMQKAWRLRWPRAETFLGDVEVVHSLDLVPPPTRLPLVMTWHESLRYSSPEFHPVHAIRYRKKRLSALPRAAVVVVNSTASASDLTEVGCPREKLMVVPPGFDLPDVEGDPPVEGPFVLAAGAITPRKGLVFLARAMKDLGPSAPPLVLAGPDGYRADDVKQEIKQLLPPDRCLFLGETYDKVTALYRHATVVCHPSLDESFGMVCLEAMGCGAAVVAADIPSIREMGEGSIVLVPKANHIVLAEAIKTLIDDEAERCRLGALARDRASGFTWDAMATSYSQVYRRAAGS